MTVSLPEFKTNTALVTLLQHFLSHGALLIRGAFDPAICSQWLPRFQADFLSEDAAFNHKRMPEEIYQKLYRFGHARYQRVSQQEWLSQILKTPFLRHFLRQIYGPEIYVLLHNSFPRRQNSAHAELAVSFHQDYEFIGVLRSGINIWVPLTPAGGAYPGLDLTLNCPQRPLLHLNMPALEREKTIQELKLENWSIQMQPGDLLLFSFYTLHRTALSPAMQQTRFSSEIRVISPLEKELIQTPLLRHALVEPSGRA